MFVRKNMDAVIQAIGSRKMARASRICRPEEGLEGEVAVVVVDFSLRRRRRAIFFSRGVR